MTLVRAVATVSGLTLVSRVLGLVRDIAIAALLGAGPVADAFFVAFKLPNFFRRLFAEGAFNAGFVPLFAERLTQDGPEAAKLFAERALAVLLPVLLVFVTVVQIAMPGFMLLLAPGFADDPQRYDLAVAFARLTFPYLLFISVVSLLGGVLNAVDRFAAVAATPIVLNLCLIAGVTLLAPAFPTAGHALSLAVAVAGMAQFVWLLLACRRAGFALRLRWPSLHPEVKRLWRLVLPAALGAGVFQIGLMIDVVLASLLPTGAVSYLFYADRLNQMPIGIVGVAVGTALLPRLSRQLAAGQTRDGNDSLNRAVELCLLLTMPAAVALIMVPGPLIATLFERGAFDAEATAKTAAALVAFAIGVPAYVLVKVLGPGYFARQDTRTPVRVALLALALNIVLAVALLPFLAHVGLALATALAAWLNAGLLAAGLWRRGHWTADARLRRTVVGMLLASVGLAALLWGLELLLAAGFAGGSGARVLALAALVVGGLVGYAALAQLAGAVDWRELPGLMRRRSG
ncbi:MAG: murein biosynthesis integral membrane protein MurJ [Alphaproteobacteria bacterium]